MASARLDKRFQSTALRAKMKKLRMQISTAPFLGFTGSDKNTNIIILEEVRFFERRFLGKEEKMKILEEIKENLAEGRKSPMEEIYETRNGFFYYFH